MTKPTVQCRICHLKFTGAGAGKHTSDTGHEWFDLLIPKKGKNIPVLGIIRDL